MTIKQPLELSDDELEDILALISNHYFAYLDEQNHRLRIARYGAAKPEFHTYSMRVTLNDLYLTVRASSEDDACAIVGKHTFVHCENREQIVPEGGIRITVDSIEKISTKH
jgi:hypothetical protein